MRQKTAKGIEIGARIRGALCELGISQRRLAYEAGVSVLQVNSIINGYAVPRLSTAELIAGALGVQTVWIYKGDDNLGFGERLRNAREQRNISQEMLADKIGVNVTSISNYENNKTMPSSFILMCICQALEASADWLLGLKEKDA